MTLPTEAQIRLDVERALSEDIGPGDITALLVPENEIAHARVICRENATIAGTAWFDATMTSVDPKLKVNWQVRDGEQTEADQLLCTIEGPARSLLTAERTALNFLQTLSATATATRRYVDAIAHTRCRLLDTRKTLPGLRLAQKYAVTCGGGHNHRIGLYDAILIKENHIIAAGSIPQAISQARTINANVLLEVEVETLDELKQALDAGADRVLLDNFTLGQLREAVALTAGRTELEASGGITLGTIAEIAETGVDYISTGALTKDIKAVDLSMRFTTLVS